ncbi:MAG: hypothetical protein ACFFD2_26690 [Promethearchaeota archaeon]
MNIKDKLKEFEEQVSEIKDPELKKIAFQKLMDSLSGHRRVKTKSTKTKGTKKGKELKRGRPGPKVILIELLNSGYFNDSKFVSEIQQYLKHKTGYIYKSNEISTALLRMLRNGRLTRNKKEKGKYEWKKV